MTTTEYFDTYCPSLVAAWQAYIALAGYEAIVQSGPFGLPTFSEVVDVFGFWSINLVIANLDADFEAVYRYIAIDSPSSSTVPARMVMQQAGISVSAGPYAIGATDPIDPSIFIELWDELVTQTKKTLLITCTDASPVDDNSYSQTNFDGYGLNLLGVVVVQDTNAAMVSQDRTTVFAIVTHPDVITVNAAGTDVYQTSPGVCAAPDLSTINQALSDMVMQDTSVAINYGSAIYSAKGKTTTS